MALRVLERVDRGGAFADLALHASLGRSGLSEQERALVTELVYGTLRWRGRLDYGLTAVLDRPIAELEPPIAMLLRLGAYQILFTDRLPVSIAVDLTVRAARAAGLERGVGLVNAVLRRFARTSGDAPLPDLATQPLDHLVHALSLPRWLAERWLDELGAEAAAELARVSNAPAPLTVRANPRRSDADALLGELRERFPETQPCRWAPRGLVLGRRGNPGRDPGFLAGRFTVQDEGSQLVVALLGPQPGERVLDVCAAPGTKTTAIAEEIGDAGRVLALDRNARRLGLVSRDARRLGLGNVRTQERDATRSLTDLAPEGGFDRVLVDAPCSGLGTLRRNPDARWRIRPEDPARLAEIQASLLRRSLDVLRPGGVLVYSTCTLAREENEAVVEALLADTPQLRPAPLDHDRFADLVDAEGVLRCLPHRHDTDGFFAARFQWEGRE